ncbi:hypothetical protein V5799_007220 [Amblyomma americanum]|uniref:Uncharacterized protein n=1 Tax=Amblyomma americanum TaxID=6943 RepID=A0AAQ4DU58_AMBAM
MKYAMSIIPPVSSNLVFGYVRSICEKIDECVIELRTEDMKALTPCVKEKFLEHWRNDTRLPLDHRRKGVEFLVSTRFTLRN